MKTTKLLVLVILSIGGMALACGSAAQAAKVAVFANTTYVDFRPGNPEAEASNIVATLVFQAHTVTTFTSTTASDIAAVLAGTDVLVVPELEKSATPSLLEVLDADAEVVIHDFVDGGGVLIIFGSTTEDVANRTLDLANQIFGFSLITVPRGVTEFPLNQEDIIGTTFQGGANSLAWNNGTMDLLGNLLPENALRICELEISRTGSFYTRIASIPVGRGYVMYLGWDMYDASPTGSSDDGWTAALNSAVNWTVDPEVTDVALFADDLFQKHVQYQLAEFSAEASNLHTSIQAMGSRVLPFPRDFGQEFERAVQKRDVLVVPSEKNTTLSGLNPLFEQSPAAFTDDVADFVNAGGALFVFGEYIASNYPVIALLNGGFGYSLASATESASTYSLDTAAAAGTPFEDGPATLPDNFFTVPISLSSLPPEARAIYRNGDSVAVALFPVGRGFIVFFGWTWFDAQPVGIQDGGWLEVLRRALESSRRAIGRDFDGGGLSDILWRDTSTGETSIWQLHGFRVANDVTIGAPPLGWNLAGVGDFNGDGQSDILWRNTDNGTAVIWQMDGVVKEASQSIGKPSLAWTVAGVGDFDGDRKADILWRNTGTGSAVVWKMDGFSKTAAQTIGAPPLEWEISGLGDFNRDGRSDILWRKADVGNTVIWQMDGFSKVSAKGVGAPDVVWKVSGLEDFNGDGSYDIVWRHTDTGNTVIWMMDGFSKLDTGSIGAPDTIWQLENVPETNGDGRADVLWRNSTTGANIVWRMNGFSKEAVQSVPSKPTNWDVH